MLPTEVFIRDINLGDTVRLSLPEYGTATVFNVTEDEVHLVRPYIHLADSTSYTGGVMHYTGTEIVKLWRDSDRTLTVLSAKALK